MRPTARIEILNSLALRTHCFMRVPAKDTLDISVLRVSQSLSGDFIGQPEPDGIESLQKPCEPGSSKSHLLQVLMNRSEHAWEQAIVDQEPIKLVAVNSQMSKALELPLVFAMDRDADQMRHHLRESVVVVSFHPDNLDAAPRIRELSYVAEKLPVLFFQPPEIQIAEYVAEENKAAEGIGFKHLQRGLSTADLRAQVQV